MKYFLADTDINPDYDVFMLMEYFPGDGETGIDGDEFYCIGKFYADDLASAKAEFESIKSAHPNFDFHNLYVDNYNEYFDDNEENEYGMPVVYDSIETLIDSMDNEENYWRQLNEEEELPFNLEETENTIEPGLEYLDEGLQRFGQILFSDKTWNGIVADYSYDIVPAEDVFYVTVIFEDGDVTDNWKEWIDNVPEETADSVVHYLLNQFYKIAKNH